MSQAAPVPSSPIGAAPDWRAALLPPAKRRFWVFSDLQQSDPDNARRCMETGVRDFLSLRLAVDAVCYLGDSTEGENPDHLREMSDMQVRALARVDAPVFYAMGNHEFDLFRASDRSRVVIPIRDRIRDEPQWHVTASVRDWLFVADFGDLALALLSDHADESGAWWTTHGVIHGLPEGAPDPHGDEAARTRERIAALGKPVFTMSHYPFPGGNREAPLQAGLLPLPRNAVAHFYGHSHIGDAVWGRENLWRQVSGIDNEPVAQFDIASLENRRGSVVRSAVLEWYGGDRYGVFFRDHTRATWERVHLSFSGPA